MSKKLGSMTDAEFLEWSRNFLQRIVSGPQTVYGLTVEQADALGEAQGGFTAAFHVAAEPLTRTKGAVAQRRKCVDNSRSKSGSALALLMDSRI